MFASKTKIWLSVSLATLSPAYASPFSYATNYLKSTYADATNLQDKNSINKIANLKTIQTMRNSQKDKNLIRYNSLKEMFNDCWK